MYQPTHIGMINTQDLNQYLVVKKQLDKNSIKLVLSRFGIIVKYLNGQEITRQSMEGFIYSLKERNLKNNSINAYIFTLKYLYAYLKDRKIDIEDFTEGLDVLPKNPPVIIILSVQEIERLLNTDLTYGVFRGVDASPLNQIYKTFTRFLASTGCRFEEAASLKVKYLDLENGRAIFIDTKNKTNRDVYINGPLVVELGKLIQEKGEEELVFTSFIGSPIIPQNYNGDLKRRAVAAGITKRVHPHLLRHSYATHLYIATKDIGLVQVVLGHKDIKSTMIYIHLAGEIIKEGMMRHPVVRKYTDPSLIVSALLRNIEGFELHKDQRFDRMKILEAINTLTANLYQSLT